MLRRLFLACMGITLAACGGAAGGADAGGEPGMDSGSAAGDAATPDSGAERDAGLVDSGAGEDAGPREDAGAQCAACVDETLRWELDGGFVPYQSSNEIRSCRTYVHTRSSRGPGGTSTSCSNRVPCLGDAITIDDVNAALAHPDVVAAFAAAPVLYGVDARPVDGPLFQVTQGGRTISIGFPCEGRSGCTDIPPGVAALRTLLTSLEGERLGEEDCASTFPPRP